jgi:hypothetical protein
LEPDLTTDHDDDNVAGMTVANSILVPEESFRSREPFDLVQANVTFVNALFTEFFRRAEIPPNAFRSYCVDYYRAQVQNGGFSQFVFNSRWAPEGLQPIREGLARMGAREHLAVFEEGGRLVDGLARDTLAAYLGTDYFGDNPVRDLLNAPDQGFRAACDREDLIALNADWLRGLPELVTMPASAIDAEVRRRGEAIPERAERVREARAKEPRDLMLERALCERAGHTFIRRTGADRMIHRRTQTWAYFFLTDHGSYYMIDAGTKAIMFKNRSFDALESSSDDEAALEEALRQHETCNEADVIAEIDCEPAQEGSK